MQINPLQTVQDNILALVNAKNTSGTPFTSENVSFAGGAFSVSTFVQPSGVATLTNDGSGLLVITKVDDPAPLWKDGVVTIDERAGVNTISFTLKSSTEQAALDFQKWFPHVTQFNFSNGNVILDLSNRSVNYIGLNGESLYEVTATATFVVAQQNTGSSGPHVGSLATHPDLTTGSQHGLGLLSSKVNRKLTIAATANAGFSGSKDVYYGRLNLVDAHDLAFDVVEDYIDIPVDATKSQILDAVCAQIGLVRDAFTDVNVTSLVQPTQSTTGTFRLTATSTSLLYFGAIAGIKLRYPQQDLNTAVADNEMDGFNAVV